MCPKENVCTVAIDRVSGSTRPHREEVINSYAPRMTRGKCFQRVSNSGSTAGGWSAIMHIKAIKQASEGEREKCALLIDCRQGVYQV